MKPLARLQSDFLRQIGGAPTPVADALDASTGISPALGLQIYGHAYGARLREALRSDHAALADYLGDAGWQEMSGGYIDAHPSRHRSLRQFGAALPEFLRRHWRYRQRPELAELAAFERALLDSFDAADALPTSWTALLALPESAWPALCPLFHPSLDRQRTRSNCVQIWLSLQGGGAAVSGSLATNADWVIWRDQELVTRFRSLPGSEAAMLDHFLAGGDFAGACELLLRWSPADEVPAQALQYLGQWCADGWIRDWFAPRNPAGV